MAAQGSNQLLERREHAKHCSQLELELLIQSKVQDNFCSKGLKSTGVRKQYVLIKLENMGPGYMCHGWKKEDEVTHSSTIRAVRDLYW